MPRGYWPSTSTEWLAKAIGLFDDLGGVPTAGTGTGLREPALPFSESLAVELRVTDVLEPVGGRGWVVVVLGHGDVLHEDTGGGAAWKCFAADLPGEKAVAERQVGCEADAA
jgi:hypothetical protein